MSGKKFLSSQWAVERLVGPQSPQLEVRSIPVSQIDADPEQPRRTFDDETLRELGESIRDHGLLQPIRVRAAGTSGRYIVVAGERRLRASRLVGLATINAIVASDRLDIDAIRVEQAIENLHRDNLSPREEAEQFARLIAAWGCSQAELARRLRKGTATISRALSLLEPPPERESRPKRGRKKPVAADKRRAATYDTRAGGTVRVKRGYTLEQLVDELRQVLEHERRADAA
jgi:ParB/RepB/Spo0J family partition protein